MTGSRIVPVLVGLVVLVGFAQVAEAQGCSPAACTGTTNVDHTFALGSRWRFIVESCPCEGMVIRFAYYTPRGGTERLVLSEGSVSEIHVPYVVGTPRPLDVTNAGIGFNALTLSPAECSGGTLVANDQICENVDDRGYAWKFFNNFQHGEGLSVFMASQLGQYTYINRWEFRDDGTIEPRMGLTGKLQWVRAGAAYASYGSRLDDEANATPQYGISHLHNIYYRLDFDIGGSGNDEVERMVFQPSTSPSPDSTCATPGTCGTTTMTPLLTEGGDDLVPRSYTSWFVHDTVLKNSDGRPVGYEIMPHIEGLWSGQVSDAEPWAAHEFWVTVFNPCEKLAVGNYAPHISSSCSTAAPNLAAMANGQSIAGQDVVVWYIMRHLHVPRDEDQANMPIKWMSFTIAPRNFYYKSPIEP